MWQRNGSLGFFWFRRTRRRIADNSIHRLQLWLLEYLYVSDELFCFCQQEYLSMLLAREAFGGPVNLSGCVNRALTQDNSTKRRNLLLSVNLPATSTCEAVKTSTWTIPTAAQRSIPARVCVSASVRSPTLLSRDGNRVKNSSVPRVLWTPHENTWTGSKLDLFKWWAQKKKH